MQAAPLTNILAVARKTPAERTQEEVHALVVLLTEQLRTFGSRMIDETPKSVIFT